MSLDTSETPGNEGSMDGSDITVMMVRVEKIARNMRSEGKAKLEYLEELDEMCHKLNKKEMRKMLGDHLARMKVGAIFKKSLKTNEKSSKEFQVLLRVLTNLSHSSRDIRIQQGRVGILRILVQCLKQNVSQQELPRETLTLALGTLYNCGKENENRKFLKNEKATEMLFHYSEDKDTTISMLAILSLSYIIDEKSDAIAVEASVIGNILTQLKEAMESKNHQSNGWTALELVSGLKNLSANRDNGLAIVKKNALEVLMNMLLNGSDDEKEASGETIWMLAFQEENKQVISKSEALMKILKDMSETAGPVQESAKGTLWLLESKTRVDLHEKKKSAYNENKPHIMISYQWDSQELMDRVYEELRAKGYNMWMDIHRMSGSILEAMAEAVENAGIVLVCMSQKYEDSPNCRTEAEYAYNLRKTVIPIKAEQDFKARGWLGAMVGTKLYIDFSSLDSYDGETFNGKIEDLALEIERSGVSSVTLGNNATSKPAEHGDSSQSDHSTPQHGDNSKFISDLTTEDVLFLRQLQTRSPDTFYKVLSGSLTIEKLREIKQLAEAIEKFQIA